MKRKANQDEIQATPSKKANKSVSFSKDAQDGKKSKPAKRGKFEKPTERKKTDKPGKPSASSKPEKPEKSAKRKIDKPGKPNLATATKKPFVKSDKKPAQKNVTPTADGEKPNWLEFKKEKKELKEKRRAKRLSVVYEPSVKAKLIGEKLRRADCSPEERAKLSEKLYELLKGSFNKAIFTHDMSRVIQWLIKYCSSETRRSVITELKPSLILMFQSKYAKNIVKKALKHGTDEIRKDIISSCYGHVVKLVSHSVSSSLIDYAYTTFATDLNKLHFRQEFYGDMYKQSKDDKIQCISDVYASAQDMKSATLSAVKINLVRALNKKLVASPIVQAVLLDYLGICNAEDRAEVIVALTSSIGEICRSETGAKIAMICIWHGTTKDRKSSLKAIKQQVKDTAMSEHGHILLMAMFDSVDDTVLMKKLLLPEILSDLVEIATNEYGRRVILYLVARRDGQYFHPALVEQLKQGDENTTSKKPADIREKELVDAVIEPLLDSVAEETTSWLASSSIAMVTLAILKRGHGEKLKSAFEAIAEFIVDPESKLKEEDGVERSAVEHSGLHMMLKKLILTDRSFAEKELPTFGQIVAEKLETKVLQRWIDCNRGCFLLILILENSVETVAESLKLKIKSVAQVLKSKKGSGATILLKKINLIDYAYTTFATDLNKLHFRQEFYGDMYKQSKDDKIQCISDVFASAQDMKSATLSAVKINLVRALNKKLVASPIVQAVLLDYLGICNAEDRAEVIVALTSTIGEICRSETGAKIAMICIWHGTTKDRKSSLKAIKQQVKDTAMSEHGHILLMAMFDSVDDTVLMKKLLLPEILSDLVEIATNEYGRRVILYLVARRDGQYFHPALVEQLKQGDENATSKKPADIREKELVDAVIEPLLDSVAEETTSWLASSSIAMVTLAILKRGHGEKLKSAFEAIAEFIVDPESKLKEEDGVERSAVEHSGLHMMLKKLILTDRSFAEKELPTFGQIVAEKLETKVLQRWIDCNRGCFLLILILENSVETVAESLKLKIKSVAQVLKSKKGSGATILLKKIK